MSLRVHKGMYFLYCVQKTVKSKKVYIMLVFSRYIVIVE